MNNLGYEFRDNSLLNTALTHQSYANETETESYEKLEFLGDSVLQIIVSDYLYKTFSEKTTGDLSKFRTHLVSTKNLCRVSNDLKLPDLCKFGRAVKTISEGVRADLFESVLGAIYLDGGMQEAEKFVYSNIIVSRENVINVIENDYDYKSALLERLQELPEKPTLQFVLLDSKQADGKTSFSMALEINGKRITHCDDVSKRNCEKKLSKFALENFDKLTLF